MVLRPLDHEEPHVIACGADDRGRRYLRVQARSGGERREILIAHDAFAESADKVMARDLGLLASPNRNAFRLEAQEALAGMSSSFHVLSRSGLHGAHYVLPDGRVLGPEPYPEVCLPAPHENVYRRLRRAGGRDWLRVADYAVGNSRMMLALSVGLCGPILELLPDLELPMIELLGDKGGGKTTVARIISSIWGAPTPFPWSDTINCVERLADGLSGTVLVLDELGSFPWEKPKSREAFRGAIMRLFGGEGRGRLGEGAAHWRLGILSTSNISVHALAAARFGVNDRELHEAMCSRILDVTDPVGGHGVFENLHGFATVDDFVAHLQGIIIANYGVLGPAFVRLILCQPRDELLRLLRTWRDRYKAESRRRIGAGAGTDVSARVTQIFATIYAAGRLAIHVGLCPWDVRAFGQAILSCEGLHRDLARTAVLTGRQRTDDPLEAVRCYVRAERGRRIIDLRDREGHVVAGGKLDDGFLLRGLGGRTEFFVSSTGLDRICGSKVRGLALKRRLAEEAETFGGERRYSMRRPIIPGEPRQNGIAIPGSLLGLGGSDEGSA